MCFVGKSRGNLNRDRNCSHEIDGTTYRWGAVLELIRCSDVHGKLGICSAHDLINLPAGTDVTNLNVCNFGYLLSVCMLSQMDSTDG
ncbi:unnamed protein product [Urochloa humidicola]